MQIIFIERLGHQFVLCSNVYHRFQVFAFGSVPFKTYLPDGDIDLTILSHQPMEKELAEGVLNHLKKHVHDPRFKVKNVQYIEAQVSPYLTCSGFSYILVLVLFC